MSNYEIELQVQGSPSGELTQQVDGEPGGGSVSAREAEAWARGTRAGTAVSSDDPTYHNNSKYYAEQAHDAAESASAAYGTNLLAPTFDASQAYPAGAHVIHDGGYYELPEGHTAGDTWAETSKTQQTVGGEVTGLKSAVEKKADVIDVTIDTHASVITFHDGADDLQMALNVAVEPVQDLHGYENPWPAGGGKNKLPCANITTQTINGIVCTVNRATDGALLSVNIKGQNTSGNAEFFILDTGITLSGLLVIGGFESTRNGVYIDANFGTWIAGGATYTKKNFGEGTTGNVYIRVPANFNSSEGETLYPYIYADADYTVSSTFTPYSNICPISGWTGAKVTRTGENLWDEDVLYGYWSTAGFMINANNYVSSKNKIKVKPNTKYYFVSESSSVANLRVVHYDLYGNALSMDSQAPLRHVFQIPADCYYVNISFWPYVGTYNGGVSFYEGETDLGYFESEVETYEVTFPSSAGTVYGGTLTLNQDGTGSLVVDRAIVDLGSLTWSYWTQNRFYAYKSDMIARENTDIVCESYKTAYLGSDSSIWVNTASGSNQNIYISDSKYSQDATGAAALKADLNGVHAVYDLGTIVAYTITAPQVKTLLGVNNIWADTGDILSVDYPADTKLYVDQQIAEKVSASQRLMELIVTANREDTMTATKAYSSGDLLIVNGTLYKASTSIANGATLTEGTNVTATTVAAEIAALA